MSNVGKKSYLFIGIYSLLNVTHIRFDKKKKKKLKTEIKGYDLMVDLQSCQCFKMRNIFIFNLQNFGMQQVLNNSAHNQNNKFDTGLNLKSTVPGNSSVLRV